MTFPNVHPAVRSGRRRPLAMLMCLLLLVPAGRLNAQHPARFTANGRSVTTASLDQAIETMLAETGIPALSLAVIEDNQVVYSNAYGLKSRAGKEKANPHTVFEACSLSKSFLVFVVHQLVDEGKLDLDKPMYQYQDHEGLHHDARYKRITPRMVLSHSSGLENWRYYNNDTLLEILHNPGERYIYSGEGYNWLAGVVEAILNQPYESYITERVIKPLHLKHTFLKFETKGRGMLRKESPSDYALGHNYFGDEVDKWKNEEPVPASGYHLTAHDYATLIVSMFGGKLSGDRLRDLATPAITQESENFSLKFGPGFEILYCGNDTIISHGGSNLGFKGHVFYSLVHKRGMVYLTNSDRGKLLLGKLCQLTADLPVSRFVEQNHPEQYPSDLTRLLKVYETRDASALYGAVEELRRQGRTNALTLAILGEELMNEDWEMAKKILAENALAYPQFARNHYLLGNLSMDMGEYQPAYAHYVKAKALNFDPWEIGQRLSRCEAEIADAARRDALFTPIDGKSKALVQAEDYNQMRGVRLQSTSDEDRGVHVGFIDNGDWMNYKVDVAAAGTYPVTFRVTSQDGGGVIQIRSGTQVLATVEVVRTGNWSTWTTLTTQVDLPKGPQTLNFYAPAGGFAINWLQFSPPVPK